MSIKAVARALIASTLAGAAGFAQAPAHSPHVMTTPADVQWGPAPPVLPSGAQFAVLDGDPSKPGPYTVRLKMPDGYRVAPHWHPADENIVVLQGVFSLGLGDAFVPDAVHAMPAGSFARMPTGVRHFAVTTGETIVQVYGEGPFVITYVNPADDPTTVAQKPR